MRFRGIDVLFIDWRVALMCMTALAVLIGSIWGFRKAERAEVPARVLARLFSGPFAAMSTLLLIMMGCNELEPTHTAPLYSPNGTQALRSDDFDAGALGGWTAIILHS